MDICALDLKPPPLPAGPSLAAVMALEPGDNVPAWRAALAGASGTVISRSLLNPVDKAIITMQVHPGGFVGVMHGFQRDGFRSMWQGVGVNALRVGMFGGIVSLGYAHGLKLKTFDEYDPLEPLWRGAIGPSPNAHAHMHMHASLHPSCYLALGVLVL